MLRAGRCVSSVFLAVFLAAPSGAQETRPSIRCLVRFEPALSEKLLDLRLLLLIAKTGDRELRFRISGGTKDNYFLNNAAILTEGFLKSTKNPHFDGQVDYGRGDEHCWNGDQERPNAISRLRYLLMDTDKILETFEKAALPGADTRSWRY
jgi:hypothetical protein